MFQGRYGNDQLNQALGVLGLILIAIRLIISFFARGAWLNILSLLWLACLAVMLFRMFSRNFEARRKENEKFLRHWYVWQNKAQAARSKAPRAKKAKTNPTFEERRKYKYFSCTQCSQRLRVPRGKGKLRVTCTRCGNKFEIKS